MKASFILTAALAAFSGVAAAEESGFYAYGSLGKTTAGLHKGDIDSSYEKNNGLNEVNSSVSARPAAYQFQLGYQFEENSAIELGYGAAMPVKYKLMAPTHAQEDERIKIIDVVYAATLPLSNGFSLTARAGVAHVQTSGRGPIGNFDGHATRITGGLGAKYNINKKWAIRTDWNGYTAPSAAKLNGSSVFTVGVEYKF